jgi:hypothetical protein
VEADEHKYITFRREDFFQLIGLWTVKYMRSVEIPELVKDLEDLELPDAVVIRRQDRFASPCLLTYAAMISIVAENYPDEEKYRELQVIADYFHQQGVLAGEEGFKLPDL